MMHVTQVRMTNPIRALQGYGQSIWLDDIRRSVLTSGALQRLILEEGVTGLTSNPAIFKHAISETSDYADALSILRREAGLDAKGWYERLAIEDIQSAADLLQPVYARTRRRDGYVSLEVSPHVAHDRQATLEEAQRLWDSVGRDNLMIKIPATPAGLLAIPSLIGMGINVNVTLLFAQDTYVSVAEAYLTGLEELARRGGDLGSLASVASFFISRIDTAADAEIAAYLEKATGGEHRATLKSLQGKIAVANAKLAYQRYQAIFSSSRWQALARQGAHTQRLLWASTGTKNPQYRDVQYVEELIGPETVNTIPPPTLDAFRDHGRPESRLMKDLDDAEAVRLAWAQAGLSMQAITDRLLEEGLQLFRDAYDQLLMAIESQASLGDALPLKGCSYSLPAGVADAVQSSLREWKDADKVGRLWDRDPSLWTGRDEDRWLGWLDITEQQLAQIPLLTGLAGETLHRGFTHVLLLGMGGSSLCPEVLTLMFGTQAGCPELHVLDSTDPAQIRTIEKRIRLASTLFIVSSKSGKTLEPMILKAYFFDRVQRLVGTKAAVRQFIAITDSGSPLQQAAEADDFRHLYFGVPTIGGRYSALSNFGMVPAAVMGLDIVQILEHAEEMVEACFPCVPVEENPGLVLGTILGVLGKQGRDKVTIVSSPGLDSFGAWLEQLLAESTGKGGKGLIPVDREAVGDPAVYGLDRVFVYLRWQAAPDQGQDVAVNRLELAGYPVIRIAVSDRYDVGQEFFRWEFATAVAGAIMDLNPFDQPDVEASKLATRQLTIEVQRTGALPPEAPILEERGLQLFADPAYALTLQAVPGSPPSLAQYLAIHLNRLAAGDYFALLAYLEVDPRYEAELQALRLRVRDIKRVATCMGFGPRFLHSTGQAYKGGPNTGLFLQVTCEDAADLPVPGQPYTFGIVKAAQARGDFQVLVERRRRVLRVHLGTNVQEGLAMLRAAVEEVLV